MVAIAVLLSDLLEHGVEYPYLAVTRHAFQPSPERVKLLVAERVMSAIRFDENVRIQQKQVTH